MNSLRELKFLQQLFKTKNLIYLHRKISFFYSSKREKNIFKEKYCEEKKLLTNKKVSFLHKKRKSYISKWKIFIGKWKVFYVHPEEKNLKKNKQLKRSQLLHRKISLFKKQLTRIKQVIDQSSIKKAFSAFLNNFFYVQPTLVFHAQEGCCIVCNFDAFFKKI